MRAFVIACQKSHAVPETLISISDLRWLRPVCVGDRIAWHFMPIAISTSETGGMIVTSRNSGTNQNAVKVYEFTAKILISHRK
jgi:acyl dehydratase